MNITSLRLQSQRLVDTSFISPIEVVDHLGAMQAQDYPAAKWGIGLRMKEATDEIIENDFNDGKILRTHIMRPTWHFVIPEDLVWMQRLTSENVKKLMGYYNKKLELTDELFKKANKLIAGALKGNNYLTRQEIKKILEKANIKTDVQRLAHIVMWAELDSLICSGPRIGKQFSYALLEERVKKYKNKNREESLASLAEKYFLSHGPAQLKDFSWWSGFSMKDSEEALSLIKSKLNSEDVNGRTFWFSKNLKQNDRMAENAFLLSIFDEYAISYKDRTDLSEERRIEKMISMGNALTAVVILDGKVAGTWKRKISKSRVEVTLNTFRKISSVEKSNLEKEVSKYAKFLGLEGKINIDVIV